jgi:hypothetical protein
VISRVTAPPLLGIPLPPETALANPLDLLVEADSSHIPEIDHQPFPPFPSPEVLKKTSEIGLPLRLLKLKPHQNQIIFLVYSEGPTRGRQRGGETAQQIDGCPVVA